MDKLLKEQYSFDYFQAEYFNFGSSITHWKKIDFLYFYTNYDHYN